VTTTRPTSTRDLRASEHEFLGAMKELGFGYFENLEIIGGELILVPGPIAIRHLKFGPSEPHQEFKGEFELKAVQIEFFSLVRNIQKGKIRNLTVRHGLPFTAEVMQVSEEDSQSD